MKKIGMFILVFLVASIITKLEAAIKVIPAPEPVNTVFITGSGNKGSFAPYSGGINCVFDSAKLSSGRVVTGPTVGRFLSQSGLVEFTNAACFYEPGISIAARGAWASIKYGKSFSIVENMLVVPTATKAPPTVTLTRTPTKAPPTKTPTKVPPTPTTIRGLPSDWQSQNTAYPDGVQTRLFKRGSLVWAYKIINPPAGLEGENLVIEIQKDVILTVSQGAARFNLTIPIFQVVNYLNTTYSPKKFTLKVYK
jgi:hypothetical protein